MQRRRFLSSSLAASAGMVAVSANTMNAEPAGDAGAAQFYQLRRYQLVSGAQPKLTETYFREALLPALNRMGITPVGAFSVDFGPDTPSYYLLMPSTNLEALVTVDLKLAEDSAFVKAAAAFWSAPASAPAFGHVESSLLRAFPGHPRITPPAERKAGRVYQMRTYRSPSYAAHVRKVEMFHSGEFEIFAKAGCEAVFYADAMVGAQIPNLTYMLTFPSMEALTAGWDKFRTDPDWKKLSADPRFAYEAIVSNINNLVLKPLGCSQV